MAKKAKFVNDAPASEVLQAIEALEAAWSHVLTLEVSHQSPGWVRVVGSTSDAFIKAAIVAVESSLALQKVGKLDVAKAYEMLQLQQTYLPLVKRLDALRRTVTYTLKSCKANVAGNALQIYAVAKALARDSDGAELVPLVKAMKRALKRSRKEVTSKR